VVTVPTILWLSHWFIKILTTEKILWISGFCFC